MASEVELSPEDWGAYVGDPNWLPYDYARRDDSLVFAYLPRAVQRRALFLDQRFLAQAVKSTPAPIHSLPLEAIRAGSRPMHFIFHTSFCCSTLLTRAFDIPGVSMGLKEPSVLLAFADSWATGRRSPGARATFNATLDLLSRPLAAGETQIVKPANIVNYIIPAFMHWRDDAKALLLYSSLDSFLRSIARRGLETRNFARGLFQQFATAIPLDEAMSKEELFRLSDLQIAAQAWLMQVNFLNSVVRLFGPSRVRVLNNERLLADVPGALDRLAQFFDLQLASDQIAAIADGPVFKEHAKQPLIPFDAAAHKAQQEQAGTTHFEEINAVRAWARRFAARLDLPTTLEDSL